MRCEQARQLFDAYLDGELSSALATELGAHRLRCANCRRELALLEVTGHVLRGDVDAPELSGDFSDRLLRCVEESSPTWAVRLRRGACVGGPLAAAAVIVLAFCGVFDGTRQTKVAGVQAVNPAAATVVRPVATVSPPTDLVFEDWLRQTSENLEAGRRTGESLQQVLDGTFSDVLELLDDPAEPSVPGPAGPATPATKSDKKDDVEDL